MSASCGVRYTRNSNVCISFAISKSAKLLVNTSKASSSLAPSCEFQPRIAKKLHGKLQYCPVSKRNPTNIQLAIRRQSCDTSAIFGSNMLHVTNLTNFFINRLISTSSFMRNSTSNESKSTGNPTLDQKCIKKVTINACGELYSDLSKTNGLYANAPTSGVNFEIEYYDSLGSVQDDSKSPKPTVCILHGAPGKYNDFSSLISYLSEKKIRVLAPNFPDYQYTPPFRHSPAERNALLMKFFETLKVTDIWMLVGHSSAVYTMFQLLENSHKSKNVGPKLQIRSLGLFSTPTYNLPANLAVTPLRIFMLRLFDFTFARPIIRATIELFVKLQGIRNKVDKNNIENLLMAASAVGYSNSETSKETLKLIREEKIPTYVLYGLKDRLIPPSCFEQLKRDLAVNEETQVKRYDLNGAICQEVNNSNELVQVSEFASGGHYIFQRFPAKVNEDLYNFLSSQVLTGKEVTRL